MKLLKSPFTRPSSWYREDICGINLLGVTILSSLFHPSKNWTLLKLKSSLGIILNKGNFQSVIPHPKQAAEAKSHLSF